jgi:peptide/nickel transport system substrate-binding protein
MQIGRGTRTPKGPWRRRASVLAVAGALVLAGCGVDDVDDPVAEPDVDADPDDPDTDPPGEADHTELRIRTVMDITSLDPNVMPSTTDDAVAANVLEGLVTFKPGGGGELVNVLAEEIELSDDGLRVDFTLKEGVQFHGGYGELTADDVKFSFERVAGLIDDPVGSSYAADWATLEEVEVTGTYTGTIHLSEPFPPLLINTLPGNAGYIVPQAAIEELGEDFGTNPVGTGPYEFVSWTPGQEIVLERFADYTGQAYDEVLDPPQWERIVFVPIEDATAADIAIETGEVDFGQISTGSVERFEADAGFVVDPLTTFDYGWIGMNVLDDVLSDVNIRRAVRQALDIDAMIEAGFDGQVTRAHALISPEMPIGHWADAPVYQPDPEAARAHLEDAAVDELDLTMIIDDQVGSRAIAEIAQANLAAAGINLQIDLLDGGEYREIARDALHQLFYISFSNTADPSWATVWFSCDQVGDWNYMHWCNEEFQELHEAALVETDPQARHDMYVEMQRIMDEDAVAAWVMYRTNLYTFPPDLQPSLVPERYGKYLAMDFRR